MQELRVLVVDDSGAFRRAVQTVVDAQPGFRVHGTAADGLKAMEQLELGRFDLVLLDQEMPGLDGIETLSAIQGLNGRRAQTVSVIMLSAHTRKGAEVTLKSLELGALDFVTKPEPSPNEDGLEVLRRKLVPKLNYFASMRSLGKFGSANGATNVATIGARGKSDAGAQETNPPASPVPKPSSAAKPTVPRTATSTAGGFPLEAIAIGVSTGGPKALGVLLPRLCELISLPILLVQHMPAKFTLSLAESLALKCSHRVVEAVDGERVESRTVYIAPGGRHMEVRGNRMQARISIHDGAPENGCRPSVDTLFRSLPAVYGSALAAVILTGMGSDGASGLEGLARSGCHILAQDEGTSVVWGMPGSAVATGLVHEVAPLEELPGRIAMLVTRRLSRNGQHSGSVPAGSI